MGASPCQGCCRKEVDNASMEQPYFLIGAQWLNPILKSSQHRVSRTKWAVSLGLDQAAVTLNV